MTKYSYKGLALVNIFPIGEKYPCQTYLKMNSVVLSALEVSVHSEWGRNKSVSFGQRTQLDSWVHYPKENSCNIVK